MEFQLYNDLQEILPLFDEYNELRALDLGCDVGHNSICVAERFKGINCIVDGVDLLEIAIEKLQQNAKEHNVTSKINGINKSIEEYGIGKNSYDFILAVSALEHIENFCEGAGI